MSSIKFLSGFNRISLMPTSIHTTSADVIIKQLKPPIKKKLRKQSIISFSIKITKK